MINRKSSRYLEDRWRVKIAGAFLEKGYDIRGVVHVGANDGYEVQYYLGVGIDHIMCFEPHPKAIALFKEKYAQEIASGKVKLFEFGLGSQRKTATLRSGADTGQSSTFLRVNPEFADNSPFRDTEVKNLGRYQCEIRTFKDFLGDVDLWAKDPEMELVNYDCLVIDVEGMELDVLIGMGDYINHFKYLNIECSERAIFTGQEDAKVVVKYLVDRGFVQDTPIEPHNDIMFIRKDILK